MRIAFYIVTWGFLAVAGVGLYYAVVSDPWLWLYPAVSLVLIAVMCVGIWLHARHRNRI